MQNEIHARELDSYRQGKWRLMQITQPGTFLVPVKEGEQEQRYSAGDVLIAGRNDSIVVPPVTVEGAIDLAQRILEGDSRAVTDPLAVLALAAAVCGFIRSHHPFPETEQAAAVAEGATQ